MGKYYFLVAGLANLDGDDSMPQLTPDDFLQEVLPQVSAADRRLLELSLLECDCRRLAWLLEEGRIPERVPAGMLSLEQLEEAVGLAKAGENRPEHIPQFMWDFIDSFVTAERKSPALDGLLSVFYDYALRSGNRFVSDWYRFNQDLSNVQTAITARKYGLDVRKLVVGDGETARQLRESGARDWGLSGQLDFFDALQRIQDEQDLAKREHMTDMLRWKWLEENSFFSYFAVEYLFSYMERLAIAWRWNSLDHDAGEKLLRGLIGELKGQVSVPDGLENN